MTIFVFFCIGAGLVLSGVFISKVLSPIEDVTTTKISVQSKLNCSAIKRRNKYQNCVDKLMLFRNYCQDFLEGKCSYDRFFCENACYPKYNEDLKKCPCQVKMARFEHNILFYAKIHCEEGCPCPSFDCLNHNKKSLIKNETLTPNATDIFLSQTKPAKKLTIKTTVQTTSKGSRSFFN